LKEWSQHPATTNDRTWKSGRVSAI